MSSNKNTTKSELKNIEEKSKLPLVVSLAVIIGIIGIGIWYYMSKSGETKTPSTTSATIKAGSPQTPTEAYKKLFAIVKEKNKAEIKAIMSKDSIGLGEMQAGQSKKELDEVLANAFTATTFADKLPPMRDERVKDRYGAVEVFNQKDQRWEDIPFIIEDGVWKLAIGNLFAGNFQSPGKSRTTIERENANAAGKTDLVPYGNGNVNTNVKPKIIDPMKDGKMPPTGQNPPPKKP